MNVPWPRTLAMTLLLAVVAMTPCGAQAPTPVGLWSGPTALDTRPSMTETPGIPICFRSDGSLYYPGTPGSVGIWFQKGNHVRALVNISSGLYNDSLELDFSSDRAMAGSWTAWRDGFQNSSAFVRVSLTRTSTDCPAPARLAPGEKDKDLRDPRHPAAASGPP